MLKGALDLESGAWGPNPRPAAIGHPAGLLGLLSLPVPHEPGLPETAGRDMRCEQKFLPRMRSDSFIHWKVPSVRKKVTTGQGGKCCYDPEKQPRASSKSLDPEYAAWHLVGGSYPDSGLGQSRLLKGQNDILQPGRCQIPHSQRTP